MMKLICLQMGKWGTSIRILLVNFGKRLKVIYMYNCFLPNIGTFPKNCTTDSMFNPKFKKKFKLKKLYSQDKNIPMAIHRILC